MNGWTTVCFALALIGCGGGQTSQARTAPEPVVEFEDEAPPAEIQAAEDALLESDPARALAALEPYLREHPRDARAWLDSGLAHELRANREASTRAQEASAAESAYTRAIELAELPEALNNLGVLRRESGARDEALALFRRALAARASFASAQLNLAMTLEDAGQIPQAIAAYRDAARMAPRDPSSRSSLGLLLLGQNDAVGALAALREALPLAEHNRAELSAIGNGLRRAGDATLAVRALREAIAAEESPAPAAIRAELALALFASGERPLAESALRELIADEPRYADAHYVLGNMLAARREWTAAAEQYQAFLRLAPDAPQAEEARGRLAFVRRQH
jgi:Tfp pilus assembly protein PilF